MATSKEWDRLKTEWNATLTIADLAEEIEDPAKEQTYESIAVRELERGFPLAVQSLVSLAIHAEDPRVRRGAANDVVNHNLALMQARAENRPGGDKLLDFMQSVTKDEMEAARDSIAAPNLKSASLPPVASTAPAGHKLNRDHAPDEPETDPTEWLDTFERED